VPQWALGTQFLEQRFGLFQRLVVHFTVLEQPGKTASNFGFGQQLCFPLIVYSPIANRPAISLYWDRVWVQ
jgi:hypothetical protein